jgi:predicted ABC-type ATPase
MIFFLWRPSATLAVTRVKYRVGQGGHSIPVVDIRRRYHSGLRNLFHCFLPLADRWGLYDASGLPPRIIAHGEPELLVLKQQRLFMLIKNQAEMNGG